MDTNATKTLRRTGCWIVALGIAGLATPQLLEAQDAPKPGVVEEDLGDGFRAVSVGGGPPAIIDDATGMILKQAYGRPIVYDQETGAVLYLDDEGEPAVKFKGAPKGGADGPEQAKRIKRMKAFMKRAQAYTKGKAWAAGKGKGEGKAGKAKTKAPALTWDAILAAYLELLGADDEAKVLVAPRLLALLLKQDEIRRSAVDFSRLRAGGMRVAKKTLAGSNALPAAIQGTLRAFTASQRGAGADLEKSLPAYRAARKAQTSELANLREALRELLTVSQEAKLVAVGVLD